MSENNVAAIVLAAGKGTRLGCTDKPKVMLEIGGKPIVEYIVETLEKMDVSASHIVMVIGFCGDVVRKYFGKRVVYAGQDEQLGTAHAAFVGVEQLIQEQTLAGDILVLGGDDTAFYTKETLTDFIRAHKDAKATVSLLTAEKENPASLGRVIRDAEGAFVNVLEKEQLSDEQKHIQEISTGTYLFKREWFVNAFQRMKPIEGLGEYGLPATIAMALEEGVPVQAVAMKKPDEWFGINTKEELEEAHTRLS